MGRSCPKFKILFNIFGIEDFPISTLTKFDRTIGY